ncbi:hypothetical protein HDF24_08170 [Mucilaginibacter sp. X4EP1]|uniref:hypothetical protein n=1 Tax=Mucilaginibacter sp. X4EP1 TaxID=2723092 RepID=UPI00216929BE|nr:hypothetical protein [Mucilaginibacter sp. X4EP1]MCS3813641.1 hypothetical protein [Mucilaginibacter sp. X4EP1]
MIINKISFVLLVSLITVKGSFAQICKGQKGMVIKKGTVIRLGNIKVLNKQNKAHALSNIYGIFNIPASTGDTLQFSGDDMQSYELVVSDFTDKIVFLEPAIQLNEVVIQENSMQADFKEVRRGYRSKSVFYTGTPHYYYLFLKPMTFIYENFKSEVINARKFNRFARAEMASIKVAERFNDKFIKATIPINNTELEQFRMAYEPSIKQLDAMSDYELINYICKCYDDFEKKKSKIG